MALEDAGMLWNKLELNEREAESWNVTFCCLAAQLGEPGVGPREL